MATTNNNKVDMLWTPELIALYESAGLRPTGKGVELIKSNSDIHDLNIATIQAQPYSLSKTTAFTANNKIFPILEYYTCSNEEKELVATHIINYSMTVGAIGKLKDYIKNTWQYNGTYARNFIKGTFLKLKDLFEDYHYLNALNEELNIGVYFDEYTE